MIVNRTPLLSPAIGTQRELVSLTFGPQGAAKKIYMQASLHADETPAMLAATVLRKKLETLEAQRKLTAEIVLVPVANPIGLSQHVMGQFFGCFDLNGSQNFNRGVRRPSELLTGLDGRLGDDPASNKKIVLDAMREVLDAQKPTTEFESLRVTLQKLSFDADIVLDIHCSLEAVIHLYTTNAAWPRIEPLARHLQSKAQMLSDDTGLGLFIEGTNLLWADVKARFGDRYALPEGPVAAIIECGGEREVSYETAEHYASAILAYLADQGAIAGSVSDAPALLHPATQQSASEHFYAASSGIVVYRSEIGARVKAGDPICDIVDPISGESTTLTSHSEGMFYMRRAIRFATAGAEIGRITGG
ncbi:succinylglutamate desuccinylase [Burkholderia sp. SRS-W-2-2016]|uniref:succinylglutamate desuccinylase/aspartoacylase family protein n=1 Tax=Burkholderia sp. SRS-W-2-2016 TaxID=1926878 RepID=UPI00094AE732|nr:succinylglutamate desuccinylase/aspartoacylase family protein [Burkholderia sp. SRS-W-2-2016]OLL28500.1 succinylglutamate desuccinylase [Burkholderia sp. SRS-W-2-2016]